MTALIESLGFAPVRAEQCVVGKAARQRDADGLGPRPAVRPKFPFQGDRAHREIASQDIDAAGLFSTNFGFEDWGPETTFCLRVSCFRAGRRRSRIGP
jgi:hypothetical protein